MIMPDNAKKRILLNIPERKAIQLALFIVATALISLSLPLSLNAGTSIVITDVNAESTCSATLTINTASISFPSANPDLVPSIAASQGPVPVTASVQIEDHSTVTLTALAGGDLVSGSHTIAINNVSWTADNNSGLIAGTMSKDTPQPAGSWTSSNSYSGAFTFFLANSWSYATGTYSQIVTYTLTAP